ncbi:MAG: pectate lyase [Bacteroidales bacterium]
MLHRIFRNVLVGATCMLIWSPGLLLGQNDPAQEEVMGAMKQAASFMVNHVSTRGGYLWFYSRDLSQRFGEVPARPSQVWVQDPGTPAVGQLYLDIYQATGEQCFLDYAREAADVLVYGQHPAGGWHYFIDFDRPGLAGWYRDTASRFIVGWEEYRHYYGNCTYDDNVTQGATMFLLQLYRETLDPVYLGPLRKALGFILESQYPNGGWPQRYPLRYEFAHDGLPDYTSFYTLNDGAMNNTIDVLLRAYEILGDEEYLEAARRGGDFFMVAQGPEGRAAWTDQFDMKLRPATGRTHEPACYQARYTLSTITELEKLFLYTGDRRYLRPIPAALEWLESVILEVDARGRPVYADAYDCSTNLPIVREYMTEVNEEGYMKYHYYVDSTATYVPFPGKLPVRNRYEEIRDVGQGKEKELYWQLFGENQRRERPAGAKMAADLINSMDPEGSWIETFTVHDIARTMDPNFEAVLEKGSYLYAVKELEGYSTRTFLRNMRTLLQFYKNQYTR